MVHRCEEVVCVDMAVRQEVVLHQPHDDTIAKVKATVPRCCSNIDGEGTAISRIGTKASPPLRWLQWHVLFPSKSPVKLYHRLVDRNVLSQPKACRQPCLTTDDHRPHLADFVFGIFLPLHRAVEVCVNFSYHSRVMMAETQHSFTSPVVLVFWLHVDAHHHVDGKEIPHLSG